MCHLHPKEHRIEDTADARGLQPRSHDPEATKFQNREIVLKSSDFFFASLPTAVLMSYHVDTVHVRDSVWG